MVSDKADCGGVSYAAGAGIRVLRYPGPKESPQSGLAPSQLVAELLGLGVELVLLAGYLKLVPAELCRAFPRALLNIHPALLPAFGGQGMYGRRVHAAVIASGARCAWLGETRRRYLFQQVPILTLPCSPLFVLSALRRFSGPTVHLVDEEYDRGLILAQRCVPVLPDDTPEVLAQRVLEQARARRGACWSSAPSHGGW